MSEEIEFPNFKKIKAMIPSSVYENLVIRGVFNDNFDLWMTEAIMEKLKQSEEKKDG